LVRSDWIRAIQSRFGSAHEDAVAARDGKAGRGSASDCDTVAARDMKADWESASDCDSVDSICGIMLGPVEAACRLVG